MRTLWQDLRYALRVLGRSPGFAATVILTLALGIGVNSALFSVIHNVLLKPLPYPDPERLVQVQSTVTTSGKPTEVLTVWSYPRFEFLREHGRVFAQIAACADDYADPDARRRARAGGGGTGVGGVFLPAGPQAPAWARLRRAGRPNAGRTSGGGHQRRALAPPLRSAGRRRRENRVPEQDLPDHRGCAAGVVQRTTGFGGRLGADHHGADPSRQSRSGSRDLRPCGTRSWRV